jgi:hypothetical protein
MARIDSPGVLAQQLSALEQTRLVQDTKILQKVNAAHRVAFADKYPSQVEHCLRLVMTFESSPTLHIHTLEGGRSDCLIRVNGLKKIVLFRMSFFLSRVGPDDFSRLSG